MKKVKSTILAVVSMLIFAAGAKAETITIFDSNATIVDGNTYDTVVVKGDGTVVDMTGGSVNKLITMNASTFNMSGGSIAGNVYSYDSSVLNLSSGSIGYSYMHSYGESRINISGDISVGSAITPHDSSFVSVSGNSTVDNIWFRQRDNAVIVNITGGHVGYLYNNFTETEGGGIVNISGGTIDYGIDYSNPPSTSRINIIGHDLNAQPYGGLYNSGEITGYWNDDTPFSIELDDDSYAYVVLYDGIVPANCVNRPNSDLNGDCKVNFSDFSKMASEWLDCGLDPNSACNG
jgi:hypothetical protein